MSDDRTAPERSTAPATGRGSGAAPDGVPGVPGGAGRGGATICPRCGGTTWLFDDSGEVVPCVCREGRVRRAQTRGLSSSIPRRFRGVAISEDGRAITDRGRPLDLPPHVTREVLRFCREIDATLDDGRGIWIEGSAGTGKTTIAMLVAKTAIETGHSVAIYSVPKLLAAIRHTFDAAAPDTYKELMGRLVSVDLLQLDDLGAERQTDWVLEQLYSIINERYEDRRAIIVTTNLSPEELSEQIGTRAVSRIAEICGDRHFQLWGPDRRVELPGRQPGTSPASGEGAGWDDSPVA